MKRSVEEMRLDIPGKVADVLNGLVKSGKTEKNIDTRARIVLMCAEPLTNEEIRKRLGVSRNTVSTWRKRFRSCLGDLAKVAGSEGSAALKRAVTAALSDRKRRQPYKKFGEETRNQVIQLSLESPMDHGLPINAWTCRDLTDTIIKEGIAKDISVSTVRTILGENKIVTSHKQYYLFSPGMDKDRAETLRRINRVTKALKDIEGLNEKGTLVISADEMPGVHPLRRQHPSEVRSDGTVLVEYFYKPEPRKTDVIGFLNVTTGEILDLATEDDHKGETFAKLLEKEVGEVLEEFPGSEIVILADNLPAHLSVPVIEAIARLNGQEGIDLGKPSKKGILKNKDSRREYLEDPTHQVRFLFTPLHCSWLNPIEAVFSVVSKKLISGLDCGSIDEFRELVARFKDYYNDTLGKPFEYRFDGTIDRMRRIADKAPVVLPKGTEPIPLPESLEAAR